MLCTWILPLSLDPLQVAVDGLAQADGEDDGDDLDGRQQNEEDQDGVEVRLHPRKYAAVASLKEEEDGHVSIAYICCVSIRSQTFRK